MRASGVSDGGALLSASCRSCAALSPDTADTGGAKALVGVTLDIWFSAANCCKIFDASPPFAGS